MEKDKEEGKEEDERGMEEKEEDEKKRKRRRRRKKTIWIFRSVELFYWIHQLSKPIEWMTPRMDANDMLVGLHQL